MTTIRNSAVSQRFTRVRNFEPSGEAKSSAKSTDRHGSGHQQQVGVPPPKKLIGNLIPDFYRPPSKLAVLMDQEAALSKPAENETKLETAVREFKLGLVRHKLEQEVIKTLESALINSPLGDDGSLSRQDLQTLASGNKLVSKDVQMAAQYMLDNPAKLDELEGPDISFSVFGHDFTIADDSISLHDTHTRLDEMGDADNNLENPDWPFSTGYNPPSDTYLDNTYYTDTPNLNPTVYSNQQDAVAEAIRTGETVAFTNSDGKIIGVTIERLPSSDPKTVTYQVKMSDGEKFTVDSQIGTADTIESIANVIEWGSTSNFAEGISRFPDHINFYSDPGPAWASFNPTGNTMNFWDGTKYIDEENYYHEVAHRIGYELNSDRFVPDGYEDVMTAAKADGITAVSNYANASVAQDFSESVAAYINARENGPAALAEFKKAYPHRSAYIEKHVFA